ncbi:hypothetical protein FJ656_07020, partial [Schumannella luteola]
MVLRLDPAIPLVWRDPQTLQFGVDPVVTVLPEVTPGVERLVSVLAAGVSASGYRMLAGTHKVTERQRDRLLETLRPCLLPENPDAASARKALVLGDTPTARSLARLLDELGVRTDD